MADNKFVSNINVTDRYKKFIAAGTPFFKDMLVEHTFESLKRQGHITEYSAAAPIVAVKGPKGKMLACIPGTTPDAAIHPPTLSAKQREENAKQAAIAVKNGKVGIAEKNAAKEVAKVEKAKANLAEEEAATKALKAAEAKEAEEKAAEVTAEPEKKESTVEKIWNCNPEDIKDLKFEILLSEYRKQCDKFKLEPLVFGEGDKQRLIDKLSSQFVAK